MTTRNETWKSGLFAGGMLTDAALDTSPGHQVASTLAHWLNGPNTTVYDKAIDRVYLQTHVGGSSLHHLIDGQHDMVGAFRAAANALPDDSLWQEIAGTARHLGKDLFSVSGLPLFSLEPQTYHQASGWLRDTFHLPKAWLGDFLQVNGLEMFAGFLSASAVVLGYQQQDIGRLAELGGASGLAAALSANPMAMAAAAVALVLAWKGRANAVQVARGACIGAGSAAAVQAVGAGLGLAGLGSGLLPALGCVAVSVVVGLYARNLLASHIGNSAQAVSPVKTLPAVAWQLPDIARASLETRLASFDVSQDLHPEVISMINKRINCI